MASIQGDTSKTGMGDSSLAKEQTPPIFCLTSLLWEGVPMTYCADDDPDPVEYGQYNDGGSTQLTEIGWSAELMAHVYKPVTRCQFEYTREKFYGELSPMYKEFGGIWGNPNPDPLLFLHRQDNLKPFGKGKKDKIKKRKGKKREGGDGGEDSERATSGAPFRYKTNKEDPTAWTRGSPDEPPVLSIPMPDLQVHDEVANAVLDTDSSDDSDTLDLFLDGDEDSVRHKGFRGSKWVDRFLEANKAGDSLGMLEKTIWTLKNRDRNSKSREGAEKMWAVKIKLEPIVGTVQSYPDWPNWVPWVKLRKQRLTTYEMRATVLEVYIKPEFITKWLENASQ